MNENKQIRREAWQALWDRSWFWKLLGAYLLLQISTQVIAMCVNLLHAAVSGDNAFAAGSPGKTDIPFALLYVFIVLILSGISKYGMTKMLNRAADDDSADWLKDAFGGFRIPLGLAWLGFRVAAVYAFYLAPAFVVLVGAGSLSLSLLGDANEGLAIAVASGLISVAFVLGTALFCIPFYRYRYLFRIKADNPDWTAGECMSHCRRLVSGEKWRMFKLDCSYWKQFLPALLMTVLIAADLAYFFVSAGSRPVLDTVACAAVLIPAYFALVILSLIAAFSNGVGQSVLYRKISAEKDISQI